jgi:hypothetical protein
MKKSGNPGVPLRDWSCASYSPTTGRAAKSSMSARLTYDGGDVVKGWNVSAQISQTRNAGKGGAPGISAMDKSGSGDPGRVRFNRDGVSDSGGRADGAHPSNPRDRPLG